MAIATLTSAVAVQNKTSGATLTAGTITSAAAGATIVLYTGFDNLTATTPTVSGISVPSGETATWQKAVSFDSPQSGSAGGVRGELWYIVTTQTWTSFAPVITYSAAITAKTAVVQAFSGVGALINAQAANWVGGSSPGPSVTLSPTPTSGQLVIAVDTAETAGSTSTAYSGTPTNIATSGGGDASNVSTQFVVNFATTAGSALGSAWANDQGILIASWAVASSNAFTASPALSGGGALAISTTSLTALGSAALSGAGTLAATVLPKLAASAAFTGSGQLAAFSAITGSAAFTGAGTLAAAGTPNLPIAPALSGSGALAATGAPKPTASVSLSGAGALATTTSLTAGGSAALSGSGSLAAAGKPGLPTSPALSGSGTLAATGVPNPTPSPALSGAGQLAASAAPKPIVSLAFSGSGQLAAVALAPPGQADLSGAGQLAVSAKPATAVGPALSGVGTLAALGLPKFALAIALSGSGALAATGTNTPTASPAFSGAGTLAASSKPATATVASLSGAGTLAAGVTPRPQVLVVLTGAGQLAIGTAASIYAAVALSGSGLLEATGTSASDVDYEFTVLAIARTNFLAGAQLHADIVTGVQQSGFAPQDVELTEYTPDLERNAFAIEGVST